MAGDGGTEPRSRAWREVWDHRDPDKLGCDGYESHGDLATLRPAQVAFITETLELRGDDHLLDLGCGTGALTAALAPHVGRVTAVDYSSDATAAARLRLAPFGERVEVVHHDVQSFDLSSVGFTKALAVGSLHYLDGEDVLLRIISEATAHGAPMLVMDLPDAAFAAEVRRDYDQTRWSHLSVDPERLQSQFPGSTVHRGMFPFYDNDAVRFSLLVPGRAG